MNIKPILYFYSEDSNKYFVMVPKYWDMTGYNAEWMCREGEKNWLQPDIDICQTIYEFDSEQAALACVATLYAEQIGVVNN